LAARSFALTIVVTRTSDKHCEGSAGLWTLDSVLTESDFSLMLIFAPSNTVFTDPLISDRNHVRPSWQCCLQVLFLMRPNPGTALRKPTSFTRSLYGSSRRSNDLIPCVCPLSTKSRLECESSIAGTGPGERAGSRGTGTVQMRLVWDPPRMRSCHDYEAVCP